MTVIAEDRTVLKYDQEDLKIALAEGTGEDWKLQIYNADSTHSPDVERELERLMVLKDYNILGSDVEPEFEDTIRAAKDIFVKSPSPCCHWWILVDSGSNRFKAWTQRRPDDVSPFALTSCLPRTSTSALLLRMLQRMVASKKIHW